MTDIPYLSTPGFPHRVYRHLVDIEDGDRCREDWTGNACLCVSNRDREYSRPFKWQRGMATPQLAPPAEPWRPRELVAG